MKVKVLVTQLCPTHCDHMTATHRAPLSTGFSRQEYWSGLPFPSPVDLPAPGIEPGSLALQAVSLPSELPGKSQVKVLVAQWYFSYLNRERSHLKCRGGISECLMGYFKGLLKYLRETAKYFTMNERQPPPWASFCICQPEPVTAPPEPPRGPGWGLIHQSQARFLMGNRGTVPLDGGKAFKGASAQAQGWLVSPPC